MNQLMRYFVQFERNETIYCFFEIYSHKSRERTNHKTQSNKKKTSRGELLNYLINLRNSNVFLLSKNVKNKNTSF
jgi:hypothetical protein